MGFFVITGGPGVGKSALIAALKLAGYKIVAEDARAIIKAEQQSDGDALPWKNKHKYLDRMLEWGLQHYTQALEQHDGEPIFFDRSLVDALCYAAMEDLRVAPAQLARATACRYEKLVFILPPWEAIYENDAQRKQSWGVAEQTYSWLTQTYTQLGYTLIEVPKVSVPERCAFVIAQVKHFQQLLVAEP